MNWPEALTAMTFMVCITALLLSWYMLSKLKGEPEEDSDFIQRLQRHGLEVTVMEPKKEFEEPLPPTVEDWPTNTTETDHDSLEERIAALERRV